MALLQEKHEIATRFAQGGDYHFGQAGVGNRIVPSAPLLKWVNNSANAGCDALPLRAKHEVYRRLVGNDGCLAITFQMRSGARRAWH